MHLDRRALLGASAALLAVSAAGCGSGHTGDAGAQLDTLLNQLATDFLRESPEFATTLGVSEEQAGGPYQDRLSDPTRDGLRRVRGMFETGVTNLRALDTAALTPVQQVTVDVVATALENQAAVWQFEPAATQPYVVSQLTGAYTTIPDFLDSQHAITSRASVEAYIARVSAFARNMDEESRLVASDSASGLTPPDFAIDRALTQLRAFAGTAPAQTVLVSSLARRITEVAEIPEAERAGFLTRVETAVRDEVLPAYGRQIAALEAVRGSAVHDAGCYRLPRGEELYAASLRFNTTTSMTADEIHTMGAELVASLQSEMEEILRAEGLTRGTTTERIQSISRRANQLYPNTDAGRDQLLADLNAQVQAVNARMPEFFGTLPRAPLEIKRVPAYTEAGAPGGYYQPAALDGSRPGAYYINLRNTAEWPRFRLPTLTYHEGVPGHHFQIAIQQEAQGLPFIRSALLFFNAYNEGWGLYAEQLADEIGVYANDRLARLGYLQSAAFRASRLVVDTGMHAKRWTREQAIQSMVAATGNPESSTATEIERYAVWPGQACGYMVGRQAIVRMREAARTAMGDRFDIKGFHDTVLTNGAMPLSVTEQQVQRWSGAAA